MRQIALASARLTEGAKDPRVGAAIRRQQDAGIAVSDLQRQLDAAAAKSGGAPPALEKQLARTRRGALADADAALQAAAPNYGQLVQEVGAGRRRAGRAGARARRSCRSR